MAPSASVRPESRAEECGFEGESDLYGLGIRLGVYMQWISALIIVGFRFQGDNYLSQSYTMFVFAVFLAVLVITARSDPTYVAEMLVLTYIIFGGSFVISGTREKNAPIRRLDLDTVSHVLNLSIMMCLLTAAAVYCAWFWLRGMYRGTFLETPCGTYGFLFAKVSLYDRRVTGFFAALSIVATISHGLVTAHLALSVARVAFPARWNQLRLFPRSALLNNTNGDSESDKWAESRFMKVARTLKACILAYSILGIELTLHWNGITDVYDVATTGQLIPFTIGLCGLVKIIFTPLLEAYALWNKKEITSWNSRYPFESLGTEEVPLLYYTLPTLVKAYSIDEVGYEISGLLLVLTHIDLICPALMRNASMLGN